MSSFSAIVLESFTALSICAFVAIVGPFVKGRIASQENL
jgi:hypothetical protein